jgi:type IV secretory pathway protease TraF
MADRRRATAPRSAGAARNAGAALPPVPVRVSRPERIVAATILASLAIAIGLLWHPRPLLLWNPSPSSPPGLYRVTAPGQLAAGSKVIAWAPLAARRLAAERNYLPFDVPLVKPVAAVAGDRVCARRKRIFVNGGLAAVRRRLDPSRRPIPWWWSGCHRLRHGELFLLSKDDPFAFDGRYFGVTRAAELVGGARLLVAAPTGAGR